MSERKQLLQQKAETRRCRWVTWDKHHQLFLNFTLTLNLQWAFSPAAAAETGTCLLSEDDDTDRNISVKADKNNNVVISSSSCCQLATHFIRNQRLWCVNKEEHEILIQLMMQFAFIQNFFLLVFNDWCNLSTEIIRRVIHYLKINLTTNERKTATHILPPLRSWIQSVTIMEEKRRNRRYWREYFSPGTL